MTSLTLVRRFAATPEIVFDALVTSEGIASWWGPDDGPVLVAESDARVGGRFRVRFRMRDDSEHEATGEYLVVEKPARLAMTFRWQGEVDDTGPSRIEVVLRAIDGGTEMTFTHADLADDATRDSHAEGWSEAFAKLERRLGTVR